MARNEIPDQASTDKLIHSLSLEAGKRQRTPARTSYNILAGLLFSGLAAISVVLLTVGARPDLSSIISTWIFQFKAIGMILIAGGAMQLFRAVIRPGATPHAVLCLIPGVVFMLCATALDQSGFPVFGVRTLSALTCMGTIVLASLPALGLILRTMRRGIPTQLAGSGAVAGLLSGAIGGLAYTLACRNDGAAFVTIWYSCAIAMLTVIGAILGPRVLRW
jgi:hypothetical protein